MASRAPATPSWRCRTAPCRTAIVEKGPALVGPTSGVVVGGDYVYIAVSQWEAFDDDGKRNADGPAEIRRLKLAR